MKYIDVYPTPALAPELPENGVAVAIDALRATTTITTALANGADAFTPFETVEETIRAKETAIRNERENAARIILGGERGGLPIAGFDLGNSPRAYDRATVEAKTIYFTTTNGTKAILACRGRVLLASYLNANAVVARILESRAERVSIVCAGTNGDYTEEDLLLAGLLTERLTLADREYALNVQAEVAREQFRHDRATALVERLRASRGGQNLKRIGLARDIADAARLDSLDVVPECRRIADFPYVEIKLYDAVASSGRES